MIEIPESLTLARQLNETVKGKKITGAEAGHTEHRFTWYEGDPAEYDSKMSGNVFGTTYGIGSMIETEIGEYRLTIGDGVNVRYYEPDEKLPVRYQARITFEDESCLICTVQMYGMINLFLPDLFDNEYYKIAKKKPLPCTDAFSLDYFRSLRTEKDDKLSTKAFLATKQRIPGLGNGVLQDILFEAGLHPKRHMATISEEEYDSLYDTMIGVLVAMRDGGGRDTEKDLFGQTGGYITKLSKKTPGGYCPKCGGPVERMAYLGGNVYVCDNCQPMMKW